MNIFDSIKRYSDAIALLQDDGESITYSELQSVGDTIASHIPKRSLVFSFCSNSIGSVCGYTGFIRNKVVPLLLDPKINPELLNVLFESYRPEYVWIPNRLLNAFTDMDSLYSFEGYSLLRTEYSSFPMYQDLALLLTTSGSTGSPKLVRQSYKNILANTQSICEYLSITDRDRPITTLPMSYTYGLSIINTHLYAGATILLTDRTMMEKRFWDFLKSEHATTFGGVPYTYEMLKRLGFFSMQLPSLKVLTQAGGKLNYDLTKEMVEHCETHGIKFIVMYGQTEATARMSYLPSQYALLKCGSMGKPIPNGEFWLRDEKGNIILDSDVVGELVYKGPNVTLGYAERGEDLALGDERGGILVTGDMAKRDADGFYYIVGRKKRFVKIFGNRVNLDETERILKRNGYVCACSGKDDLMIIYTENKGEEQVIQSFIAEITGLNKQAFFVKYIKSIPKNEAGKTLYSALEGV